MDMRISDIWPWKNVVLSRQVVGFALVGLLRTVLSYLIYLGLLAYFPYWVAFTCSYVLGLSASFYANGRFVFAIGITLRRAIRYFVVYSSFYTLSLGILVVAIEVLGIPASIAPVCVIALMFPLNFVAERFALTR
jgi:putative flippase GtrA